MSGPVLQSHQSAQQGLVSLSWPRVPRLHCWGPIVPPPPRFCLLQLPGLMGRKMKCLLGALPDPVAYSTG